MFVDELRNPPEGKSEIYVALRKCHGVLGALCTIPPRNGPGSQARKERGCAGAQRERQNGGACFQKGGNGKRAGGAAHHFGFAGSSLVRFLPRVGAADLISPILACDSHPAKF